MPASLMPVPKIQFFGANGAPLSNGYLYTYANNQPGYFKESYTDASALTKNTNPIILDTQGRASVWLDGFYTMELWSGEKSINTSTLIWTQDDVSAIGGTFNTTGYENIMISYLDATAVGTYTIVAGGTTVELPISGKVTVVKSDATALPVTIVLASLWQFAGAYTYIDLTVKDESITFYCNTLNNTYYEV